MARLKGTSLTASDRSRLIEIAASLPNGDKSRKAILAGLKKASTDFNVPGKHIFDKAEVSGNAKVSEEAQVSGYARVFDNAQISGSADISERSQVFGDAQVFGKAYVSDEAKVFGDAEVYGNAIIGGKSKVSGLARVFGRAYIVGDAEIVGGYWDGTEGHVLSGKWKSPGVPA